MKTVPFYLIMNDDKKLYLILTDKWWNISFYPNFKDIFYDYVVYRTKNKQKYLSYAWYFFSKKDTNVQFSHENLKILINRNLNGNYINEMVLKRVWGYSEDNILTLTIFSLLFIFSCDAMRICITSTHSKIMQNGFHGLWWFW